MKIEIHKRRGILFGAVIEQIGTGAIWLTIFGHEIAIYWGKK